MNNNIEFENLINDIINNDLVKSMNKYIQHCDTTCFEHCYMVSYYCYKISKKLNWDYKSCARGAMLHDFFLYDWREKQESIEGLHAFVHGKIACNNACKIFNLNEKEKDMIVKHMFPVTFLPPKSKEGFLLTLVDKYCTLKEFFEYISSKNKRSIKNY